MLSIQFITNLDYLLDQSRPDYFFMGGEPPGVWWKGGAAPALGLEGTVRKWQLKPLYRGFAPKKPGRPPVGHGTKIDDLFDGRALIKNAGHERHQAGWDLTFSAPKSVSILWSAANPDLRAVIQKLHASAVEAALRYLQDVATYTRLGKGGRTVEEAKLLVAMFEHAANREGDQQLHTHAQAINVCVCKDGSTRTILSQPLYEHKLTAGAVYQAKLDFLLRNELGIRTKQAKVGFEIPEIPSELVRHQSKRREAIEKALGTKAFSSAKASHYATLATRPSKVARPRAELFEKWQETNRQFGFTEKEVRNLLGRVRHEVQPHEIEQIVTKAVSTIAHQQSHFSEQELLRESLRQGLGHGIAPTVMRKAVADRLSLDPSINPLGRRDGYLRYTTAENHELEGRLVISIAELADDSRHVVSERIVTRLMDRMLPLVPEMTDSDRRRNEQQRSAVSQITMRPGAVQVISGVAGAGKTYALKVANAAWKKAGLTVVGLALAGVAARKLQEEAGIQSNTLANFLTKLQHAKTVHGPCGTEIIEGNCRSEEPEKTLLDKNTVLVLDEASMVPTREMTMLVDAVKQTGAKLIVLGDRQQIPAIEAGGPMAAIEEIAGKTELTHITRQELDPLDPNPHWQRQVVEHFRQGKSVDALVLLAERGRVSVLENREQAKAALIHGWTAKSVAAPKEHLILASTNADVQDLNVAAQKKRAEKGLLGVMHVKLGDECLCLNDRVRFTARSRQMKIENGDFGTIVGIKPDRKKIVVKLDRGDKVEVSLKEYDAVRLGYAATTHSAQGSTFEHVSVLVGGAMQDLNLSYVQASRHKKSSHFYTDRFEAGKLLEDLAIQMAKSNTKDLALDVLREHHSQAHSGHRQDIEKAKPTLVEVARHSASRPLDGDQRYFVPKKKEAPARLDLSKLEKLKGLLEPTQVMSGSSSKQQTKREVEELRQRAEAERGKLILNSTTGTIQHGPGKINR